MRILHVNSLARKEGGAEVFLFDLMDWSREKGHTIALFAGDSERSEETDELCVVQRPEWQSTTLIHDRELEAACEKFVAKFRPDVIHLHNLYGLSVGIIDVLAKSQATLVQHVHDASSICANSWLVHGDGKPCQGGVGLKCLQHGCKENYPFDGRVLTATNLRAEALRRSLDAWIVTSNHYADVCRGVGFAPATRIPYWSPSDPVEPPPARTEKRVLFLGRLVREKGVEVLLRAWPKVAEAIPDAILDIVGDGPLRGSLEQTAESLGIDPKSCFRGRIPHNEVHARMQGSSALIFPSIWMEAFGIINHESFRAGLPVIASRIGGIPEVVSEGETGLLFEPRNSDALAEAIIRLLNDEELHARMVASCLERAEGLLDDQPMRAVFEVYEEAKARGTEHRQPVDLDLLASTAQLLDEYAIHENGTAEMQKHINFLSAGPGGGVNLSLSRFIKKVVAKLQPR